MKTINTITFNQLDKNSAENSRKRQMDIPGSMEEAQTNNDLETSSDLANDFGNEFDTGKEKEQE